MVAQLQDTHSGVEEDVGSQPIVAQVQHTPSGVDEGAGLQSVVAQIHNITEEGSGLQSVGTERRAVYETTDHTNTLERTHTENESPGLDRFMSQRHGISTATSYSAHHIVRIDKPLVPKDTDDDVYLSATSGDGEGSVSLHFS